MSAFLISMACSKSDPKPLGAQVNAQLLAGDAGKSKSWKLREFSYKSPSASGTVATATLPGCFMDNVYTFTNNAEQTYSSTEGTSKCFTGDPDTIETGTWAFTLDGLKLNVDVDNSQSPNGLFSGDIYYLADATDNTVLADAFHYGYTPYPAFVNKLDANNLVLQINSVVGTSTITYTLTFTPA